MASKEYTLSGTITNIFGSILANIHVLAYKKNLRSEVLLGEALTDKKGQHEIGYSAPPITNIQNSLDLFIRVLSPDASEVLGTSKIYFNAPSQLVLDYTLKNASYKGLAEFNATEKALEPILEAEGIPIDQIGEHEGDIEFLAGQTGREAQHIAYLCTKPM